MEQRTKYGSALLLMLIIILALYGYFHDRTGTPAVLLDRSTASISAQSLIRIAATDDTGFAKKYLYKTITVGGIIRDIRMGPNNIVSITLGPSPASSAPSSPASPASSPALTTPPSASPAAANPALSTRPPASPASPPASPAPPSASSTPVNDGLLIDCILDSAHNKRHPDWNPGDSCTIQGTCAGQLQNIILVDCVIISTTKK